MRINSSNQASDGGDEDAATVVIEVWPLCFPRVSSSPPTFLKVPTPVLPTRPGMRGFRGVGTLVFTSRTWPNLVAPWPGHFQVLLSSDSKSDLSMGLVARGEGSFL